MPLALAILSASNPQLSIVDTLSKLSHDNDAEVSHNSIFAMGIVGAGQCYIGSKISLTKEHSLWSAEKGRTILGRQRGLLVGALDLNCGGPQFDHNHHAL